MKNNQIWALVILAVAGYLAWRLWTRPSPAPVAIPATAPSVTDLGSTVP